MSAALPVETEAPAEPAYRLDDQVGFILRQVQQRHTGIFSAALGEDMTPTQWAALARLAETGECSQNRLGRLIATDVATIKGIADRLIRRGLVETRADPADRRRLLLRLTETGLATYRDRATAALAISAETLAPLSKADQATFLRLLDLLR